MPTDSSPLIVHLVHSLRGGGTEQTLVKLLNLFDSTKFRHMVMTLRDSGALAGHLPDHVACRPLHAGARNRSIGVRVTRLIRAQGAKILHARGIGCWFDATVAGLLAPNTRVVLGFHGSQTGPVLDGRQRRRARWGMRTGALFTSVSLAGRRQLIREVGIPKDRIVVLPNGVDLTRFTTRPDSTRKQTRAVCRLGKEAVVVGIVGSLTAVKEHAMLVRCVAGLVAQGRNLNLLIVGDGPRRAELIELVRSVDMEHRTRFTGWSQEVPTLLHAMDLYVCCSSAEGMNNAMLEAMATGLPIIATDVGDNATVVRHGCEGFIVEPGSSAALTDALSRVAESRDLRKRFGAASLQRARGFDLHRTVCSYEQYYGVVLNRADLPQRPADSGGATPSSMPKRSLNRRESLGCRTEPATVAEMLRSVR